MNTISGLERKSLEKELEFAKARVALLENKLRAIPYHDAVDSGPIGCWSQADHYVRLVENIDQGVFVLDRNFETVFVNKSALRFMGREIGTFDAIELLDSLSRTDRERIRNLILSQKSTAAVADYECEFPSVSGEKVVLRFRFTPLFGLEETYEGVQVFISDVTDESNVRQALEQSETMYQALFEGAGDAIFIHTEDGRLIDANRIACKRLGYTREELLELSPSDIRADGKFVSFAEHGKPGVFEEVEHITRHGDKFSVEVNSRLFYFNGEKIVMTIARNITERIQADKRAVLQRKRLKALYEMAHLNETSTRVFFEYAISRGIELSESEFGFIAQLEGHGNTSRFINWTAVAADAHAGHLPVPENLGQCGAWSEVIIRRTPLYRNLVSIDESQFPFPEGKVRNFLALPVLEDGCVVAVAVLVNREGGYVEDNVRNLGLLLDGMWNILCKKKSELKVRQSLKEKETLLKEVHHRVKNNMQVICSLLNLQTDYIKDPQDLMLIRHSIDRVRSMAYVHEQLYRSDDLSCIDFGQYISSLGLKLMNSYGVGHRIVFETELDSILLPIELALPCGLIVNELITNAINHAFPEPGPSDRISVKLSKEGSSARMVVADNGVGFSGLERSGSLGHVLIDTLVQQINGTLESFSDNGASFDLRFRFK